MNQSHRSYRLALQGRRYYPQKAGESFDPLEYLAQFFNTTRSEFGVPYGNRTRVAAVKEKRFTGIQRKPAAWIAP